MVLWTFPVLVVSYVNWPTAANVSDAEVNKRLSSADQTVLVEAKIGFVPDRDPARPEVRPPDLDAAGNPIIKNRVNIEGHVLEFTSSTSEGEMTRIAGDFYRALQQALRIRRATFVGEVLAAWTIPVAFLYGFGWAVGWIRRGFYAGHANQQ